MNYSNISNDEWSATKHIRNAKFNYELAVFEFMRDKWILDPKYKNKFIAIHNGKIIAIGDDFVALAREVRDLSEIEGPIPICFVEEKNNIEHFDGTVLSN
ncbi:MAG: DUF5678 domain-containing protein [Nanoarchaeota archaeon]